MGVAVARVLGKPAGILLATAIVTATGVSRLPREVTWRGILVIGCIGGIGLTVPIYVAGIAFSNEHLVGAAKFGLMLDPSRPRSSESAAAGSSCGGRDDWIRVCSQGSTPVTSNVASKKRPLGNVAVRMLDRSFRARGAAVAPRTLLASCGRETRDASSSAVAHSLASDVAL
jgi:hypothetical protein